MNENGSKKIVIKLSLENFLEPVLKVVKHAAGMVNVPIINQSGRVRCFWELLGKTVACSFSIGNVFIHLSSISNPWILAPVFVISALNAIFICTSTYSSLKNENDVNGKENNGSKSQGFILSERFNKGVVGLENIATNFVRSSGLTVKIPTLLTNAGAQLLTAAVKSIFDLLPAPTLEKFLSCLVVPVCFGVGSVMAATEKENRDKFLPVHIPAAIPFAGSTVAITIAAAGGLSGLLKIISNPLSALPPVTAMAVLGLSTYMQLKAGKGAGEQKSAFAGGTPYGMLAFGVTLPNFLNALINQNSVLASGLFPAFLGDLGLCAANGGVNLDLKKIYQKEFNITIPLPRFPLSKVKGLKR